MSQLLRQSQLPGGQFLEVAQGDITREQVDAIVNAANAHLQHGGGVAAAIARRGGRVIQRQSNRWVREHGAVSHAEPAYTDAGVLPCRYVIHAVGPAWGEGDEDAKLGAAVDGSLRRADELKLDSIAFPAISTGIFGFPKERAAEVIYRAVTDYFEGNPDSGVEQVRLTLFDQLTMEVFLQVWDEHFSSGEE